jgi:hypothetical protein
MGHRLDRYRLQIGVFRSVAAHVRHDRAGARVDGIGRHFVSIRRPFHATALFGPRHLRRLATVLRAQA